MKLEDIGFYSLSDARAQNVSATSRMQRCEIVLTPRCNFKCAYCRKVGRETTLTQVANVLSLWAADDLVNVRFSGGEPTMWLDLGGVVHLARELGVERVAVSTNGSAPWSCYEHLLEEGVSDFSVSLDACCAEDVARLAGVRSDPLPTICDNILRLTSECYTTVGIVVTEANRGAVAGTIQLAEDLGVHDIRVISAAQNGGGQGFPLLSPATLGRFPILRYRYLRALDGLPVRGAVEADRCYLPLDDSAVTGDEHFPCIIWMREGGAPVGKVGPEMRAERARWSESHRPKEHPICRANCLDVCVAHNKVCGEVK
jgi:hypothetical protein